MLHRPGVTRDTTRPLRATTVSLAATTCGRIRKVGRVHTCEAKIRASGEQWWAAHTWPQRRCFRTLISSRAIESEGCKKRLQATTDPNSISALRALRPE